MNYKKSREIDGQRIWQVYKKWTHKQEHAFAQ